MDLNNWAMLEDAYRMPVIEGAYCILEGRGNYTYAILDIRIILYYGTDNKTNLILLLVLGEGALDNLYLLDNYRIHSDDRGHVIGRCIYI
jgi:hypothetical protein